jgi:hypothetical protein
MNTLFKGAFLLDDRRVRRAPLLKDLRTCNPWRRAAPIEGDLSGDQGRKAMFAVAVPHRVGNFHVAD